MRQGAFAHNRKTPISKPAANAHRPNVQAETMRTRFRRSSCEISWDRCVIFGILRQPHHKLAIRTEIPVDEALKR
jgi:hypothetical protein